MKANLRLKISGKNSRAALIDNGQLQVSFDEQGKVKHLLYQGLELLTSLAGEPGDPDKSHSFYCDYHRAGKTVNLQPSALKIIEKSAARIHIAYIDDTNELGIEYHIIINNDDPAIYSYVKAWNNVHRKFKINELRTVYRLNRSLVPVSYNGERTGLQPTSAHMMQGQKLQDETYLMPDGSLYDSSMIYSKYDYAGYLGKTDLWGQFGQKLGFWLILPDKSAYGCGPLNQDLLVHYDAIVLNYMVSEHFGKGLFEVQPDFNKIFGPWCIYLNNGDLADAKKRADHEKTAWPYDWVKDPDYAQTLYQVQGKIYSEYRHKNCTAILTDTRADRVPLNQQKSGFMYYANTNTAGEFNIAHIRPGKYFLYVYENYADDLATHLLKEVIVTDHNLDLGLLKIKRTTTTIWQIGLCTHTTAGMKFSEQLRNYSWLDLVPANWDYDIDKDAEWYYLQNDRGRWQIHFSKKSLQFDGRDYELQLSFAGTSQKDMTNDNGCTVKIALNGTTIATKVFPNDRAAYRSAMKSGGYHLWQIKLPAAAVLNNNVISITTDGYLMYDTISLVKSIID